MFAVPGWAVSADSLKPETKSASSGSGKSPGPAEDALHDSKKRKRPPGATKVTASNFADLWEQVIEGRSEKKAKAENESESVRPEKAKKGSKMMTLKEKKKLKKLRDAEQKNVDDNGEGSTQREQKTSATATSEALPEKESMRDKKKKKRMLDYGLAPKEANNDKKTTKATDSHVTVTSAAPKLTPLQAAMREKLVSARFRHLNETLYTKPSEEAFRLFEGSPEMFQEYHEGFRRQVDVWPENPVDGYIEEIRRRGRHQQLHQKHKIENAPKTISAQTALALPRTNGTCTIADLGCGDAKLASTLQPESKNHRLSILSYDLQSPLSVVTRADIANLPLADGSVNVVIFCLALMGTNWLDFVEEAYRILRWKGELWVAEIKSRFQSPRQQKNVSDGKNNPVSHSVGHRRKNTNTQKGKKKGDNGEADGNHAADLAVVVDGAEDKWPQTDVSAFVDALKRRGFVLHGEGGNDTDAIDMRNKMFVKMRFLKAASPIVGKGAIAATGGGGGGGGVSKRNPPKFIDKGDAQQRGNIDEKNILKPCVYKLR